MDKRRLDEFLASGDTLRVYRGASLVFSSRRERLAALLEYLGGVVTAREGVVILDTVMGNAAALLAIKAGCREVGSPLGSQMAIETLDKYGVKHHLERIVDYIRQDNSEEMCPMEKLSIGKTPDEFYAALKAKTGK